MKIIYILFLIILNYLAINSVNGASCAARLKVSEVKMANTHVIPIEGKTWVINNKTISLNLLSNKDSLLLARFEDQSLVYSVKVWVNNTLVGSKILNDPSKLPSTESNGPKYSTVHHSVILPKEWVRPHMKIQFSTSKQRTVFLFPNVGQEIDMNIWLLPFYLFGANDTNTQPLSITGSINKNITDELVEKWSLSSLEASNHPLKRIDWDYLICSPGRNNKPAKMITNSDQKDDGFEIMSVVLQLLGGIRGANGEAPSSVLYYSPILQLGANGKYSSPGGGLGGGSRGTGDYSYSGIFIHEVGHSFGLPHAGDSYNSGNFPYVRGSLLGSEWGFDINHNQFLTVNIPSESGFYKNCNKTAVLDSKGQCIKQSVMQGGSGSQSNGYRYSMFADFEMSTIQSYFRNSIYYDKTHSTGYKQWNTTTLKYDTYTPSTKQGGLYSINDGLPFIRDVDVYTVIITHSYVGPASLSQIYPILSGKGNLLYFYDPTNATALQEIQPNTGKYVWYCHASGCDYTIRVTYKDNSVVYMLLQQGRRSWFSPKGAIRAGYDDPLNGNSYLSITVNLRANKKLAKIELFETPFAWNGWNAANATLLVSKTY